MAASLLERRQGKGRQLSLELSGHSHILDNISDRSTLSTTASDDENEARSNAAYRDVNDDYDVQDVIGHGGLASVYRGVHKVSGDIVALKVLSVFDEEMVDVAEKEFRLLQRMNHPNIVRALDFYVMKDQTVLAMQFFAGSCLNVAVRLEEAQCLSEVTTHKLFTQLLEALDYLHHRRIVHRDVKPGNVMIGHDLSTLQLIDFNISQDLSASASLSPTFSPQYAAPEITQGQAPSEASDIWGAGLCLCIMLCGHCPTGSGRARKKVMTRLESLKVSGPCMAVVQQCLMVDPNMRPAAMFLLQTSWALRGPAAAKQDAPRLKQCASCGLFDRQGASIPTKPKRARSCDSRTSMHAESNTLVQDPVAEKPLGALSPHPAARKDTSGTSFPAC